MKSCDSEAAPGFGDAPVERPRADYTFEIFKLNPNCCFEACPGCENPRKLAEFRARHPHDWKYRPSGPERLQALVKSR